MMDMTSHLSYVYDTFSSNRVSFSSMTSLTIMVLVPGHLVCAIPHFPLKIPLVMSVAQNPLVVSVKYYHLVESLEYFHLVESMEYFDLVESFEHFELVKSFEYFHLVESQNYFPAQKHS